MQKRIVHIALLCVSVTAISGCGKMRTYNDVDLPYNAVIDGVKVSTVGEAVQVHNKTMQAALSSITPLSSPLVDRSLAVYIPTAISIETHHDKVDPPAWNKAAQGYRDLWEYTIRDGFATFYKSIEARNIYPSVEVIEYSIPGIPPNPKKNQDSLSLRFHNENMSSAVYISTIYSGESTIPFDHLKGPIERISSSLNFVENYVSR